MKRTIYGILAALCLFHLNLTAQVTTSEIIGRITEKGTPVPGATVTAIHTPSGTKYGTLSRKDGYYNLPNLRVGGPYTVTVSYIGYSEAKRTDIFLTLGQEYNASFSLSSAITELAAVTITSNSNNKVINNSRTGSQEVITRSQIERLPSISRSWQDFTKLAPSAVSNTFNNGLSFGGRNSSFNNVTLDGANFNNVFGLQPNLGSQTNSQPISLDAIEQIQVNIAPYDVKSGGFSGAGINSVTRSGTNEFKGSVYTYLKGPGTQGYKTHTTTIPKQDFNYNMRGVSIGGPIIRNKLFFFLSFEQERIEQTATSWQASSAGKPSNQAAGISQANADTLTKLRQFLVDSLKYNPGAFENYAYRTQSDKLTARIDWNLNASNTLTLKYNYFKSLKDIPGSNSGAPNSNRQPSITGLPFSGSGYAINNNFNIFIAELNTRFGNRASNKLQVGYTALRDFRESLAGGDFPLVDILNGIGQSYTAFGYEPFTYNNKLNSDVYQLSDIFTLYKGAHELTFGTQNYYKKFLNGFAPNYEGVFRFETLTDFYNSVKYGTANASRYQLSYSLTKDGSFPFAKIGAWEIGAFVQDKWRVNDRFTLTYGLRADLPIFESTFDTNPAVQNLTFRDGVKIDVGAKPANNPLISPRVGFNWDVNGDHKTQIRGGAGIFAGAPPFVWISNQAANNGVQFGSFTKTTGVAFSKDINKYRPASTSVNTSYNLVAIEKSFRYPQVLKASVAVDQVLPGNVIATLEGIYTKDINAVYFQNVNLPSGGKVLDMPDKRVRYDSAQIYRGTTENNPNISDAILMRNTNKGYSYNITLQLQKNFRNLYLSAAYTYSKAESVNDGGSIAQSMWRDRVVKGDPNANDLGYANYYLPHRVIAAASYKVDYAKHFSTSVGLIFEAAPAGTGSYTYNGDVNGDNSGGNNDLIYIPRDAGEIVLVPVNNGAPVNGITDTRTPSQIWAQLNNFISQDEYMSRHRGQVADRNAVVLPFYKRVDLNITQDVHFFTGRQKHTLRLTFDVINLGNMLNRNWGVYKTFSSTSFLKYEGLTATNQPKFSFPYLNAANQIPLTNSFVDNTSLQLSRWQAQFGIRYIFN